MRKVLAAPKKDENIKKRLNVRVPINMVPEIEKKMKKVGLNTKQRSSWISEAIVSLEKQESYTVYISEEWIIPGQNVLLQVSLDIEAQKALENMIATAKKELFSEDLQSSIIRTAILQKLI